MIFENFKVFFNLTKQNFNDNNMNMLPHQSTQPCPQYTPDLLLKELKEIDGFVCADFKNLRLTSHFQPIVSLAHYRSVGYEALVRCRDLKTNEPVSPFELFSQIKDINDTVYLDRLLRAIHLANFKKQNLDQISWLFLNLNPLVAVEGAKYGSFFKVLLEKLEVPAHRIVIEILEDRLTSEDLLERAVNYYRELGCLIAIDDFGAGSSNFDRIWRLQPNIVKLDRSIIVQASHNPRARRIMPGMVSLLHQTGSLVLIEGVETEQEALIAMDSDVDFIQGYYFARPQAQLQTITKASQHLTMLWNHFRDHYESDDETRRKDLQHYSEQLQITCNNIIKGFTFEDSVSELLELPFVTRCFLLDDDGHQIGSNVSKKEFERGINVRYEPLADSRGANWYRRHYFRRAIKNPNQVQITRPYLSISDGRTCVTLSFAIPKENSTDKNQVVCVDINWDELRAFEENK